MRQIRQRRANRYCKDMYGYTIYLDQQYTVIDQAKIQGTLYLLAISEDNKAFKIFKLYDLVKITELSPKRVLEMCTYFSNSAYWKDQSMLFIDELGYIVQVKDRYKRQVKFVYVSIYGGVWKKEKDIVLIVNGVYPPN